MVDLLNDCEGGSRNSDTNDRGRAVYKAVAWWNESCTFTRREQKKALRKYQRTRGLVDGIQLLRARTKARRVHRQARKQCWADFMNFINKGTPINKTYKKRRVQRRNNCTVTPCLRQNGSYVTDQRVAADILKQHSATVKPRTH